MAKRKKDIADLGEKIGGARKDMAVKKGPRVPKGPADTRPGWMKRYEIGEVVASVDLSKPTTGVVPSRDVSEVGRFVIRDTRTKDWTGQPRRATRQTYATRAEAERAVPLLAVSQKHWVRPVGKDQYEIWRKVTDKKQVKAVAETFPSRDAAMLHMAQNAETLLGTAKGFGEEIRVRPEKVYRSGPEYRKGDVNPKKFLNEFGFRGVEFGNWQTERQTVVNHAYDAMRDLADVTGIKPESLTFEKRLALAFGARGHGGKSAALAHYEPDRKVINLTKLQGAGALAHEWWHGFDNDLFRRDAVDRQMVDRPYASQTVASKSIKGALPAEVRSAYADLMDTIEYKTIAREIDTAMLDKRAAAYRTQLESQIKSLRDDLAREQPYGSKTAPATEAQLKRFDALAEKLVAGAEKAREHRWNAPDGPKGRNMAGRWTNDTLDAMAALHKEVRGRSGFGTGRYTGPVDQVGSYFDTMKKSLEAIEAAKATPSETVKVSSDFKSAARKLDQSRGKPYWETRHEMAARAFESYVYDKIKAQGRSSDYLVYGVENSQYANLGDGMHPYPGGAERQAINAKFDKLFDALRKTKIVEPGVPSAAITKALTQDAHAAMKAAPSNEVGEGLRGTRNPENLKAILANREALAKLKMPELRALAKEAGITPARSKADTIKRLSKADLPAGAKVERLVVGPGLVSDAPTSPQDIHEALRTRTPDAKTGYVITDPAEALADARSRGLTDAQIKANLAKHEASARADLAESNRHPNSPWHKEQGERARAQLDMIAKQRAHAGWSDAARAASAEARKATAGDNGGPSEQAIKTAAKLEAVAARTAERSEAIANQPRKMNTARRVRLGSGVIDEANAQKAHAETAKKIAAALRNGEAGNLAGVKSLADVRALSRLYRNAMHDADRVLKRPYEAGRAPSPADIEHAKLPSAFIRTSDSDIKKFREALPKGYAKDLALMEKHAAAADRNSTYGTRDERVIEATKRVAKAVAAKAGKHEKWQANRILEEIRDYDRVKGLGIDTPEKLRAVLHDYVAARVGKAKVDPAVALERNLIGTKIPGFFPTPEALAKRMAELADIKEGQTVLEPSAGTGRLAAAAKAKGAKVDAVEMESRLRDVLKAKGLNVVDSDFTAMKAEAKYDKILMNPPFEKGQDMAHVKRAYEHLKPGGKMVAIMGEGAFFRSDKQASEFRTWLEGVNGSSEKLPEGTFKESGTGVNSRLVVIEKPSGPTADNVHAAMAAAPSNAKPVGWSDEARAASAEVRAANAKPAEPRRLGALGVPDVGSADKPVPVLNGNQGYRKDGFWYLKGGPMGGDTRVTDPRFQAELDAHAATPKPKDPAMLSAVERAMATAEETRAKQAKAGPQLLPQPTKPTGEIQKSGKRFNVLENGKPILDAKGKPKWFGTQAKAASYLAKRGLSVANKLGAVAMIAAPVTAAVLAYDATKAEAKAAGVSDQESTRNAMMAAAGAGATTAAVGWGIAKGITWGVRGVGVLAAAAGLPVLGTAAAVGATAAGVGLMAWGAYKGGRKHGVAGVVLGAVGADALLDRSGTTTAVNGRLSDGQKQSFATADAAFKAMKEPQAIGQVRQFERTRHSPKGAVIHEVVAPHQRRAPLYRATR